jgi:hypothetical protein
MVNRTLKPHMARKPLVSTRVEHDTKDAIDAYTDSLDDDISDSEATRHLLRAGLAEKGYPVAAADGGRVRTIEDTTLEKLGSRDTVLLATLGLGVTLLCFLSAHFLATTGDTLFALLVAVLGVFTLLLATGIILAAALAQLMLARPLRSLVLAARRDAA